MGSFKSILAIRNQDIHPVKQDLDRIKSIIENVEKMRMTAAERKVFIQTEDLFFNLLWKVQ